MFSLLASFVLLAPAQEPPAAQQEQFLRSAKVIYQIHLKTGITGTLRLTLLKDGYRHDAHFQSVDIRQPLFEGRRSRENNFKDSYQFNIAAYELARMLGLDDMVPVSIERRVHGVTGALTWWVDDVLMDENARLAKNILPPDMKRWGAQVDIVQVFDQLIYNTDRNQHNLVITNDWRVWMIDHTRAFRMDTNLRNPGKLRRCSRELLARLRALDRASVKKQLGRRLTSFEIDGLLARRDKIVAIFDQKIKEQGEAAVLFDRPKGN